MGSSDLQRRSQPVRDALTMLLSPSEATPGREIKPESLCVFTRRGRSSDNGGQAENGCSAMPGLCYPQTLHSRSASRVPAPRHSETPLSASNLSLWAGACISRARGRTQQHSSAVGPCPLLSVFHLEFPARAFWNYPRVGAPFLKGRNHGSTCVLADGFTRGTCAVDLDRDRRMIVYPLTRREDVAIWALVAIAWIVLAVLLWLSWTLGE